MCLWPHCVSLTKTDKATVIQHIFSNFTLFKPLLLCFSNTQVFSDFKKKPRDVSFLTRPCSHIQSEWFTSHNHLYWSMSFQACRETNLLVSLYEDILLLYFFINQLKLLLCNSGCRFHPSPLLVVFLCTPQLGDGEKMAYSVHIDRVISNSQNEPPHFYSVINNNEQESCR